MTVYVILAVIGALLVAVGIAAWSAPAGLVAAGTELLAAGYVGAYAQNRQVS